MSMMVHASCVAVGKRGVLFRGDSGAGKSGAALRLMALGAVLVADDRTILDRDDSGIVARAHPLVAGRIEARGLGILAVPHRESVHLALIVDLGATGVERMPHPARTDLLGCDLPLLSIPVDDPAMLDAVFLLASGARIEAV